MTFWANGRQVGTTSDLNATFNGDAGIFALAGSVDSSGAGEYLLQVQALLTGVSTLISEAHPFAFSISTCPALTWVPPDTMALPAAAVARRQPIQPRFSMTASASPTRFLPAPTAGPDTQLPPAVHHLLGRAAGSQPPCCVRVGRVRCGGSLGAAAAPPWCCTRHPAPRLRPGLHRISRLLSLLVQGNLQDDAGNAVPGNLVWTARALDRTGAELGSVGPNTIPANPCAPAPPPRLVQPLPAEPATSTSTVTPTATPTPTVTPAICQRGRCSISPRTIASMPLAAETSPGRQLRDYGNPSACTSNGCSWIKRPTPAPSGTLKGHGISCPFIHL